MDEFSFTFHTGGKKKRKAKHKKRHRKKTPTKTTGGKVARFLRNYGNWSQNVQNQLSREYGNYRV